MNAIFYSETSGALARTIIAEDCLRHILPFCSSYPQIPDAAFKAIEATAELRRLLLMITAALHREVDELNAITPFCPLVNPQIDCPCRSEAHANHA